MRANQMCFEDFSYHPGNKACITYRTFNALNTYARRNMRVPEYPHPSIFSPAFV